MARRRWSSSQAPDGYGDGPPVGGRATRSLAPQVPRVSESAGGGLRGALPRRERLDAFEAPATLRGSASGECFGESLPQPHLRGSNLRGDRGGVLFRLEKFEANEAALACSAEGERIVFRRLALVSVPTWALEI